MKKRFSIIAAAMFALAAQQASAQQLQSAYFLDGYSYAHQLNPAHDMSHSSYFGFPFITLGNLNMGVNGNVGVGDVLYSRNGKLVTYLHPSVGIDEALGNFNDNNKFQFNLFTSLISFGFHKWGGYNTFDLNLRSNFGFNAPYGLFELTKNLQNKNYDISKFGGYGQAYAEVAIGHSREVYEGVRAGLRAKVLVGLARVDAEFNKLSLDLQDESKWMVEADATINAHVKGLTWGAPKVEEYEDPAKGTYETIDFDNIDFEGSKGVAGMGLAFDLGGEVDFGKLDLVENLHAGLAVRDLGFLKWKEGISAKNNGDPFEFDGFNNIMVDDEHGEDFDDMSDDLTDRLTDLYRLKDTGAASGRTTGLGTTLTLSASYDLPYYDKLSFGFTYNQRIQKTYGWHEERIYATVKPTKWFEASVNGGVGTFGPMWGWVINFCPTGFNFFIGMDHVVGKMAKQGVPLNSNANFSLGIAFPLGKYVK